MFGKRHVHVDPLKERVAKHLRTADELVRRKKFNDALVEIEQANKLDPKNLYTRSFLERTRLMAQREHETTFGEPAMLIEHRMQTISQLLASAEEFIKEKNYQRALGAVAKVYKIDPRNYYAQAFSERIDLLMQQEASSASSSHPQFKNVEIPIHHLPKNNPKISSVDESTTTVYRNLGHIKDEEPGGLSMYRQILKECWIDGIITPGEISMLEQFRKQYLISDETHLQLEKEIKITAYLDALRVVWQDGVITDNEEEVLDIMRKKYGITQEEQRMAEKKFSESKNTNTTHATILIIDPNQNDRISVARALNSQGHEVKLSQYPSDAFRLIDTIVPDLILSEVIFPNPEPDGFEFYRKIRNTHALVHTPFIMMTNPSDARIVHAGLRMGVDYFILKPLQTDFVVAVVEGKMKTGRHELSN
jgi:CheY-like chemotaxis protein